MNYLYGWKVDLSASSWCTTALDSIPGTILIRGTTITRQPRNLGFKALGVQLQFDGRCWREVDRSVGQAWKYFYIHREILCCKGAPIAKLIRLLDRYVGPSITWCSGSWNPTRRDLQKIQHAKRLMIKIMLGFRRRAGEEVEVGTYHQRPFTSLHNLTEASRRRVI